MAWSSLRGIIHGLVTTYREGQWAFIVLFPITRSQAYLYLEDSSGATQRPQGCPRETSSQLAASPAGSPGLTSAGPAQRCQLERWTDARGLGQKMRGPESQCEAQVRR